jgi:hypothetical protein
LVRNRRRIVDARRSHPEPIDALRRARCASHSSLAQAPGGFAFCAQSLAFGFLRLAVCLAFRFAPRALFFLGAPGSFLGRFAFGDEAATLCFARLFFGDAALLRGAFLAGALDLLKRLLFRALLVGFGFFALLGERFELALASSALLQRLLLAPRALTLEFTTFGFLLSEGVVALALLRAELRFAFIFLASELLGLLALLASELLGLLALLAGELLGFLALLPERLRLLLACELRLLALLLDEELGACSGAVG